MGELAVVDTSKWPVMAADITEAMALLQEAAGAQGLRPTDLELIKVPSGGGRAWEIPTLDGEVDTAKELVGVVLGSKDARAFWEELTPTEGTPPACFSGDSLVGEGEPGGLCSECPHSKFGSAIRDDGSPGPGQRCKSQRLLFMLLENGGNFPVVVRAPASSIKPVRAYQMKLASRNIRICDAVTTLALKKSTAKSGEPYSEIVPKMKGLVPPDQREFYRSYAKQVGDLTAVTVADIEHD